MKSSAQSKSEKFWDRTAKSYDREEAGDRGVYQQIIEWTRKYLRPSDTVLDLGCGTGYISNEMAGNVKNIDAIDLSSKMIEIAKTKAEKRKITNIDYLQATLSDGWLKPAFYDVVLCFYILHLLNNPQEDLKRVRELLKPGGLLISVTPCMGEKPFQSLLFSVLGKTGLVPGIRMFKRPDLERLLTLENGNTIENEQVTGSSNQYFIIVKNERRNNHTQDRSEYLFG